MNRAFFLSIVSLVLILASCQLPETGSLLINLQGLAPSRSISENSGVGNSVRLQLVRNNQIVPLGGKDFLEQRLAGQTITLDGLTAGGGYTLLMITGEKRTSGFFEGALFKASEPFEISPGVDTEVKLTVSKRSDAVPFQLLEAEDASPHGVTATADGSTLFYLKGSDVLARSSVESIVASTQGLSGSIAGLSHDSSVNRIWVNTNRGLAVQSGTAFVRNPLTHSDGASLQPQVDASGYFRLYDAQKVKANTISYYAGPGIVGAVKVNADTSWSSFESLMSSVSSTKDLLNGNLVRGFTATNRFLFLSTPIGLYRITSDLIGQDSSALGKNLSSGKDAEGRTIVVDPSDKSLVIGPVSAYSDATDSSSGSKALVFGGTYKGLFGAEVSPVTGIPSNAPTLGVLPGTTGLEITQVATSPVASSGVVYTVAYSPTVRALLVFNDLNLVKTIPAFAGLPAGRTPQFAWYAVKTPTTKLYLVVAGQDATVQCLIAQW